MISIQSVIAGLGWIASRLWLRADRRLWVHASGGTSAGIRSEGARAPQRDSRRADRDRGPPSFRRWIRGRRSGRGRDVAHNPGERHTYRADVDTSAYLV